MKQGTERFMVNWIAVEKTRAGLRHAVVCPNLMGRAKESLAQSKRARAGSLAIVDRPQVARTCILRAGVVLSFSGVTFVLLLFRFRLFCFYQSRGPSFNCSLVCMRPAGIPTQLPNSFMYPLLFLERCRLFRVFCIIAVSSFVWRVPCMLLVPDYVLCFLPCDHGLDLDISI